MEAVEDLVKNNARILKITEEKANAIISKLSTIGVTEIRHMEVIEEKDLCDILNVVEARLFIKQLKATRLEDGEESLPSVTVDEPTTSSHIAINFKYEGLNFSLSNNTHKSIINLSESEVISSKLRKKIVNDLCDAIHPQMAKPGRRVLREIAEIVTKSYPSLVEKVEGGMLIGSGYDGLSISLEHKFNNVNRGESAPIVLRKKDEVNLLKKGKKRDSYGIVNPFLKLTEENKKEMENKLKLLNNNHDPEDPEYVNEEIFSTMHYIFPLIRYFIHSDKMTQIQRKTPTLFKSEVFGQHFEQLTGVSYHGVMSVMDDKIEKVIGTIMKNPITSDVGAIRFLNLVSEYFDEKKLTYEIESIATLEDINSSRCPGDIPLTPCLLHTDSDTIWLSVDNVVVMEFSQRNWGIFSLLASYFIFNIQYDINSGSTLDFFQRYLLEINPPSGSKISHEAAGRKKYSNIPPKARKLLQSLK